MIQVWQYLTCTSSLGPVVYDTDECVNSVLNVDSALHLVFNGAYLSIGRFNAPKPQDHAALSSQAAAI